MKFKISSILILFFVCFISYSQENDQREWFELLDDPSVPFETIQNKADAYFEVVGKKKGTGWKAYKRWEYYKQQRLAPTDNVTSLNKTREIAKEYFQRFSNNRSSIQGDWKIIGPIDLPKNGTSQSNGAGRINCIAFHPTDDKVIYVGTPSGGIWKSSDGGYNWEDLSNDFVRLGISSIAINPENPNIIYVGTGDRDAGDAPGYGVWKSTNGGNSWSPSNTGMGHITINEVIIRPDNYNKLIAVASGRVFTSDDAGATWTQTSITSTAKDLALHPTNPDIVYVGGNNILKSSDGGQTFTEVYSNHDSAQRIALAVTEDAPNRLYGLRGGSSGMKSLVMSDDSGDTFTEMSNSPNILGYSSSGNDFNSQAWYDLVLACDPNDKNTLYAGGINVWRSKDAGVTWEMMGYWVTEIHADQHAFEFSPHTKEFYAGNDGGIYKLDESDDSWINYSSKLPISQLYKIGQSQRSKDLVINGHQDNGTTVFDNGAFRTEVGGDGMECVIDFEDDNYMYTALYYGDIRRSVNRGQSFSRIARSGTNGITESGSWVTPYKIDPNNTNRMYIGYSNVWVSDNIKTLNTSDVSWRTVTPFNGGTKVRDISIAPSNSDIVYFAKGDLYKITNATTSSPVTTEINKPAGNINDIEINPNNPDHLWISIGTSIYESIDSGDSWEHVDGTLPNLSINTIVYDHRSTNDAIYVGLDVGVYYTDSDLNDWIPYNNGLPNLEVTELEIYYDQTCEGKDMLRASTYGRGLWETPLKNPGDKAPVACFEVSKTEACIGETIQLIDFSAYGPTEWEWKITPNNYEFIEGNSESSKSPYIKFTSAGSYHITLKSTNTLGSDENINEITVEVQGESYPLPYSEDFESADVCQAGVNCFTNTCVLPNDWTNATGTDDTDWLINAGETVSEETGPIVDYNLQTPEGKYAYIESSNCNNLEAFLVTPCLDFSTFDFIEMSFAYHMYGNAMGSLHVDIYHNGEWKTDVMAPIVGDKGQQWQVQKVNLNDYVGSVVKVRFRGLTGSGYTSDIAIDAIQIYEGEEIIGTEEYEETPEDFMIYPNPSNGILYIQNNTSQIINEDIRLFNTLGQLVHNVESKKIPSSDLVKLNISHLRQGMYILKINGNSYKFFKK
ncbi:T9SS type A sorting domain-containing protein [Aureivirga sp. CE67]|uniref:T9SS type A sorting domain-containing protein n=1 Tax=Aureivirga sp. CE67 TaxID=1788983 RepID=UPI0018C93C47|nr:T9SS type A sorting domain-containing protein [Aureivirga sp. CE67]